MRRGHRVDGVARSLKSIAVAGAGRCRAKSAGLRDGSISQDIIPPRRLERSHAPQLAQCNPESESFSFAQAAHLRTYLSRISKVCDVDIALEPRMRRVLRVNIERECVLVVTWAWI